MQTMKIDGPMFRQLVVNGANNLRANYREVDALNVFPVPDGDTGTNMKMTIEAGVNEISTCEEKSIYEMAKRLSRGMLMGARGNSGVILSQLFRGIYKGLAEYEEVGALELSRAFKSGVAQAYKAVMKPVEGTILTVAREASEFAGSKVRKKTSIDEYFDLYLKEARASLERTPELLDVLKEAGVIDSGGAGFIYIIEGMAKALKGEIIEVAPTEKPALSIKSDFDAHSELTYGYCTEFVLQLQHKKVNIANFTTQDVMGFLESVGESIVVVKDEDLLKVHIHTASPGTVLNHFQQYGEFVTLKIENMQVQHTESPVEKQENCDCEDCVEMRKAAPKKFGVVAVASGEGLTATFKEMGVDYVVKGGQSMNPSSDDFVKGFEAVNAENIIVFPNNSNIIMTAEQAAKYYDKANVYVVPSKSLAQGYAALTMLEFSSGDIESILSEIQGVIENVTTGLITYSIRDAEFDGVHIEKGDFIGICNGKIVCSAKTKEEACIKLLEKADLCEKEIITIIYGADVTDDNLSQIRKFIETEYEDLEIDVINGKQEIYSYILVIE